MDNVCKVDLELTRGTGNPFAAYFRKLIIEETSSILQFSKYRQYKFSKLFKYWIFVRFLLPDKFKA